MGTNQIGSVLLQRVGAEADCCSVVIAHLGTEYRQRSLPPCAATSGTPTSKLEILHMLPVYVPTEPLLIGADFRAGNEPYRHGIPSALLSQLPSSPST